MLAIALASTMLSQMPFRHTKTYFIYFTISFYNISYIKCSILTLQHIKIIQTTNKKVFNFFKAKTPLPLSLNSPQPEKNQNTITIPTSNPHPPKKFTHIHQNKSQSHYLCLKPTTIEEGKEKKKKKHSTHHHQIW